MQIGDSLTYQNDLDISGYNVIFANLILTLSGYAVTSKNVTLTLGIGARQTVNYANNGSDSFSCSAGVTTDISSTASRKVTANLINGRYILDSGGYSESLTFLYTGTTSVPQKLMVQIPDLTESTTVTLTNLNINAKLVAYVIQ